MCWLRGADHLVVEYTCNSGVLKIPVIEVCCIDQSGERVLISSFV
jgi:hypothetical protein